MQVFNVFMKVLRRKIAVALIYIWVFVAVAVVMTLSDNTSEMFEQTTLNVCVFDEDGTPESRALVDLIAKKHNLVELENDRDIIVDALYYERANYILTINKGYAEKLAAEDFTDLFSGMKMHDSYSTVYMGQFLNEYAGTLAAYIAGGNDVMTAAAKTGDAMLKEADVSVASFNKENKGSFSMMTAFFFRFLPYILIGSVMNTLCPVLLVLGKKDIRFRTDCSGLPQSRYTVQLFAASTVYIMGEWLLFMIVGMFINGGIYDGRAWIAVLNSFVFMMFAAALTIFVASFSPSINLINIITQVVSLGMSFICGVFVELDMLGDGVIAAARFLPAYWYIRVNRMLTGTEVYDAEFVMTAIAIEAAFAAVFAVLTLLIRRVRYTGTARRTAAA